MIKETLLALRNKLKSKKPTFKRHDSHKKKRVSSSSYRRPKGLQNKMRLNMKGYARSRSTGFSSPQEVKGLSREGLVQNRVEKLSDFESLDAKKDGIIVSRTVGNRRRIELLAHAKSKNFAVLNIDATAFEQKQKQKVSEKQAHKKALEKRKSQHQAAAKKAEKSEKKESTESKASDSETKAAEKKEKDKILTKKGEQL